MHRTLSTRPEARSPPLPRHGLFSPKTSRLPFAARGPGMSFSPASAHRHRSSRAGMDDGRPGPPGSRSTYRGEGQDLPHWCGNRSSPSAKAPEAPCPALPDLFSRMLLPWRSLEPSLGKPAHWHGPSPKTYAIQSNTQESSSDTRSRCAKGPLDPIVGGRDLGR